MQSRIARGSQGRQTEQALRKSREGLNSGALRWPGGCPSWRPLDSATSPAPGQLTLQAWLTLSFHLNLLVVRSEHPSLHGGCRGLPHFRLLPGPISGVRPPSIPLPPRCCPGLAACPGRSAARFLPSRRYCLAGLGHWRVRKPAVGGRAG